MAVASRTPKETSRWSAGERDSDWTACMRMPPSQGPPGALIMPNRHWTFPCPDMASRYRRSRYAEPPGSASQALEGISSGASNQCHSACSKPSNTDVLVASEETREGLSADMVRESTVSVVQGDSASHALAFLVVVITAGTLRVLKAMDTSIPRVQTSDGDGVPSCDSPNGVSVPGSAERCGPSLCAR